MKVISAKIVKQRDDVVLRGHRRFADSFNIEKNKVTETEKPTAQHSPQCFA